MTVKDYQTRRPLAIFVSYFKKHIGLFILDVLCACLIAGVDLAFPLVTRKALYDMLPGKMYVTFFTVVGALVGVFVCGETLSLWVILGIVCVLGGVLLLAKE